MKVAKYDGSDGYGVYAHFRQFLIGVNVFFDNPKCKNVTWGRGDVWHDHAYQVIYSVGLWGGYTEYTEQTTGNGVVTQKHWTAPWIRRVPHRHRLILLGRRCITLLLVLLNKK
jgi:hypothetical protein